MLEIQRQTNCLSRDSSLRSGPWNKISNRCTAPDRSQEAAALTSHPEPQVGVEMWPTHVSMRNAAGCLQFDGLRWNTDDVNTYQKLRQSVAVVLCFVVAITRCSIWCQRVLPRNSNLKTLVLQGSWKRLLSRNLFTTKLINVCRYAKLN